MTFADFRVARGFASQGALAEAAGVDGKTIHRIESNPGYAPRASTIVPLAAALQLTPDELRYGLANGFALQAAQS
jgi:DNA-binding XRE family transcriptional regulator